MNTTNNKKQLDDHEMKKVKQMLIEALEKYLYQVVDDYNKKPVNLKVRNHKLSIDNHYIISKN